VHGRHRLVRDYARRIAASMDQLATKVGQIMIPSAEVAEKTPFETIAITGGVLAAEAMKLFK
jgi:tRNA(adenine34) deaminase